MLIDIRAIKPLRFGRTGIQPAFDGDESKHSWSREKIMANDWCNQDGAKRLKQKIEDYWSERGFNVDIDLVDAGFIAAMRSARTDVRSNMVNGMPRKKWWQTTATPVNLTQLPARSRQTS